MKSVLSPGLVCFSTVILIGLGLGAAVRPEPETPAPKDSANLRPLPLDFSQTNSISLQSTPVPWRGNDYHLLQFGKINFDLDRDTGHLTAELRGGATSFDNVDYDISAAVFGSQGQLLGTARAQQNVQRMWLGKTMLTFITVSLDFGSSLDYASAKKFQLSISNRKVLTPDDWQKSK